jgi:hypothetical protein
VKSDLKLKLGGNGPEQAAFGKSQMRCDRKATVSLPNDHRGSYASAKTEPGRALRASPPALSPETMMHQTLNPFPLFARSP